MTILQFVQQTTAQLAAAGVSSPRLDAQVLACKALRQNKAWLLAHGDDEITDQNLQILQSQLTRRTNREPLAYILGEREFYGRLFNVSPDVLIPRPETEQIIDALKTLPLADGAQLLDVGTGSGALAITAALELPHAQVAACDISKPALDIASQNAERLRANVYFFESDLLDHAANYDCIVANLPYVGRDWPRSPETNFEPSIALFAEDNGLALIKKLLAQAPAHLKPGGYLLLEADPQQFESIQKITTNLKLFDIKNFLIVFSQQLV